MRPEFSFFGDEFLSTIHPPIISPNLEALASKSLVLQRAYVQYAWCSPSRTSFLTSRRPDTTHVYDIWTYFRNVGGNFTTIPEYFKQNGYRTIGMGKIFHPGKAASNNDDPISWTDPYYHAPSQGYYGGNYNMSSWEAVPEERWRAEPLPDEQIADQAIATLRTVAADALSNNTNFFVAVGFRKPHLPFVFPDYLLSLYPEESISLPDNAYIPLNMPEVAWVSYWLLRQYTDIIALNATGKLNTTLPDSVVRDLRRAYYCSLSWVDIQVGRVLKELEDLGLSNDTIVTFLSDHGYHLGEHAEWEKITNFELATRTPLMIKIPGFTDDGIVTDKLTEFVDIFPTIVEAAGLDMSCRFVRKTPQASPSCTEGTSLMPLIKNPERKWRTAAFSQILRFNYTSTSVIGYTMRTHQYRYTEWVEFSGAPDYSPIWNEMFGTELYDHAKDPGENINIAMDPKNAMLVKRLSKQLHDGWRNDLQAINSKCCLSPATFFYTLMACVLVYTLMIIL